MKTPTILELFNDSQEKLEIIFEPLTNDYAIHVSGENIKTGHHFYLTKEQAKAIIALLQIV